MKMFLSARSCLVAMVNIYSEQSFGQSLDVSSEYLTGIFLVGLIVDWKPDVDVCDYLHQLSAELF